MEPCKNMCKYIFIYVLLPVGSRKVRCNMCGNMFSDMYNLKKHNILKHNGVLFYIVLCCCCCLLSNYQFEIVIFLYIFEINILFTKAAFNQKCSINSNIMKYYFNWKELFCILMFFKCHLFLCWQSWSLLQSLVLHDPSEIILISSLLIFLIIHVDNSAA